MRFYVSSIPMLIVVRKHDGGMVGVEELQNSKDTMQMFLLFQITKDGKNMVIDTGPPILEDWKNPPSFWLL